MSTQSMILSVLVKMATLANIVKSTLIINSCKSYLCMNNGTCIGQVEEYKCICVAPYWGEYCENTDTACDVNHSCPHGGDCDALTNTCECITPYTETVSIALKATLQIQCQAIV